MTVFGWDASDYDWGRGPMNLAAARTDGIDFFTLYFATQQSGLYLTPVNYHLTREEVGYQLSDSGSVLLVAHERFADVARWAADDAGIPSDRRLTVNDLAGRPRPHRSPCLAFR